MDLRTWKEYYEEQINKAKDAFGNKYVKKLLDIGMLQIKSNLAWHLSRCESPIEQILFTALYFSGLQQELYMVFVDYFVQETIEVGEHKYRADILVKAYNAEKILNIVIECDGHDFHEKTPEQAMRDKKRDRELVKAGYHVLRFTGSEIVKNPFDCVKDISKLIDINFPVQI